MTAHDGPLPVDFDFFVAPPAEIGPVLSAYSSVRLGKGPWHRRLLVLRTAMIGFVAGAVIGYFIPVKDSTPTEASVWFSLVAGFLVFLVALTLMGKLCCHYVGRDGVAFFGWKARRRVSGPKSVLLFRDAASVVTSFVDHYHNGVFAGTHYSFTWDRPSLDEPYKFKGRCVHKKRPYPTKETLLFGYAAERAWNAYQFPRMAEQLNSTGEVRFTLGKGDYILITPELIELRQKGHLSSIPIDDVEGFGVDRGVVILKLVGSKKGGFLSREKGIFRLPYARLANGQLFLMLLDVILRAGSTPAG